MIIIISCVTKAPACHHILHVNHWHCLWEIPPIIGVKSYTEIKFVDSLWISFIEVELFHSIPTRRY